MITKETVDRIIGFDGDELPVVSLYAGMCAGDAGSLSTRINSMLHEIRPLAHDGSIGRRARMSLRGDIERLESLEDTARLESGTLAVFSCTGQELFERVVLPRALHDRIVVDTAPWTRPMLGVLEEYHRSCVVVADRRSAEAWELYQDEMRQIGKVEDPALRKPNFAGWYGLAEHGVRNRADDLARRHYRNTARMLAELFRTGGHELLIIGGHPEEVPNLVEFLPRPLRERLAGTFAVDPRTATPADIRHGAERIAERYERDEERRWVSDVLDRAAEGRPAAIGLDDCLWAGSVAAVQSLLVQDGMAVPGVVCEESGWLATAGDVCPLCGGPARPTSDVLNALAEAVIDEGGRVEHVLADTELKAYMVAASLRFPLPPRPERSAA
ncbi:baeRF10 domain-containing protein [Sphaerisporangium aureirubrum]|uniref:Peptide chain release factor subunit 1 n=1 Tax=Sphaerisporangium aureirubrum TaxID=1544736 RepID=A0ABW1NIT3_9ACTN